MAQISIKILLERFTDVRGPVNDSSCVRKPREPGTLDEVVHLEVGFNEEKISWRIRLLFLKNKYVLDTVVWLLFLEHPKTSPPWPRKREPSPLQSSTEQEKHVERIPFCRHHSWTTPSSCVKRWNKIHGFSVSKGDGWHVTFSLSKITAASTTLPIRGYR